MTFQSVVVGLVITEWLSKCQSGKITVNVISENAVDIFFAYDVIDFYDLYFRSEKASGNSGWLLSTAIFAYIAMLKYIPACPADMEDPDSCEAACRYICFSVFCTDLPFVVIRLVSVGMYGLEVVDFIHPAKNVCFLAFGFWQIGLLKKNAKDRSQNCIERREREEVPLCVVEIQV